MSEESSLSDRQVCEKGDVAAGTSRARLDRRGRATYIQPIAAPKHTTPGRPGTPVPVRHSHPPGDGHGGTRHRSGRQLIRRHDNSVLDLADAD